ncbi:Selenocysteine-specific elongation factor [Halotydeus destructor]|nr:Selenocysteine-specific elongation factor [Halotydeus destructor]
MSLSRSGILNFNIGILGHVDSGKTSLCKALSSVASTAAFDKHPQSKERGITIDLGFSSFSVDLTDANRPPSLLESVNRMQFTLVDCPGHASLIRTIIGGASIIDFLILVIDVTKGIQTQTAECLVIGEITCDQMVVVLNKVDLLAQNERDNLIKKMTLRISKTLATTKFKECKIIPLAADPGGGEPFGMEQLVDFLVSSQMRLPVRSREEPFVFAIDHCFFVKGHGTVLTGTVCQGVVKVNDAIELSSLKLERKVKSMQMFKQSVEEAIQGDRVGLCVTQFDAKLMERGIASSPGYMKETNAILADVSKIRFYKNVIRSKTKFHVSLLHETVLATALFFSLKHSDGQLDLTQEFEWRDELNDESDVGHVFCLLLFDKCVTTSVNSVIIASKLDMDINANSCRLAFHGKIKQLWNSKDKVFPALKIFKLKTRQGIVDRVVNDYEIIVRNMFKKEFDINKVQGLPVTLSESQIEGKIVGSFGQSGKIRIAFTQPLDKSQLLKQNTVTMVHKKFIKG